MLKSIISEGKTTNEAIENGLKELKVSKKDVEIKVLDSTEKRSFFSILAPRIVKVELTVKEKNKETEIKTLKENKHIDIEIIEDIEERAKNVEKFLKEFIQSLDDKDLKFEINTNKNEIFVNMFGEYAGKMIGYRGETLNSLQNILSGIANKNCEKRAKILLDIEGYREKRRKTLEELAVKISKTVLKNGKAITLEPMSAYERKIIHSKLQENDKIETHSIGEEPNRRIVVSKK